MHAKGWLDVFANSGAGKTRAMRLKRSQARSTAGATMAAVALMLDTIIQDTPRVLISSKKPGQIWKASAVKYELHLLHFMRVGPWQLAPLPSMPYSGKSVFGGW